VQPHNHTFWIPRIAHAIASKVAGVAESSLHRLSKRGGPIGFISGQADNALQYFVPGLLVVFESYVATFFQVLLTDYLMHVTDALVTPGLNPQS
jgi:hypothetical protein